MIRVGGGLQEIWSGLFIKAILKAKGRSVLEEVGSNENCIQAKQNLIKTNPVVSDPSDNPLNPINHGKKKEAFRLLSPFSCYTIRVTGEAVSPFSGREDDDRLDSFSRVGFQG